MRAIAVDWSGRRTGEEPFIWLAEASAGVVTRLENGRSREQVVDELCLIIAKANLDGREPLVIGLDFSFGFPAWFATKHGSDSGIDTWAVATADGEKWLQDCPHPFWGKPGTRKPTDVEMWRACERAVGPVGGTVPKSTFQIGGAGSVGTGSIRGMPFLARLQSAGAAIWPFDTPRHVTVCEIYPRAFTGPVVKSSAAARSEYLQHLADRIPVTAASSEDAFDAAVAAAGLSALGVPPDLPRRADGLPVDDDARLEGMIHIPRH
jgi:hypothetical protein